MSIAATTGATVNNSTAGTSLACAAGTLTNGQLVVVGVAILSASVTVSSISDGSNTYSLLSAVTNSGVRIELWAAPVTTATASRTITVTLRGSALASAAYEEYSGVASGVGNIGATKTGTGFNPLGSVVTQDTQNWAVSAIAVASSSGDAFNADLGTKRQALVPALTTAGVALVDTTALAACTLQESLVLSASRAWAVATLELRTGVAATAVTDSQIIAPRNTGAAVTVSPQASGSAGFASPVPVAQNLAGGTVGTAYSETISVQGGVSPFTFSASSGSLPGGLTLNAATGVISGLPTTPGTSTFTVSATGANSYSGGQTFSIVVAAAPSSSSGGNYGWIQ